MIWKWNTIDYRHIAFEIMVIPKERGSGKKWEVRMLFHISVRSMLSISFFRKRVKHPRIYCHMFATLRGKRSGPSVWPPRLSNPKK